MYPVGSIIRRKLTGWWGFAYCHMGVYVGNGEVIHFNGERKKHRGARLRRDTVEEFSSGQRIVVHTAPRSQHHAAAVVAAAERELASRENRFNARYSFAWNNCEDFCVACFQENYATVEAAAALA